MNRRAFIAWLGGTAAGVAASHVLDVERLLWVPGERTVFLPAVQAYDAADWDYLKERYLEPAMRQMSEEFEKHFAILADIDRPWPADGRIAIRHARKWDTT